MSDNEAFLAYCLGGEDSENWQEDTRNLSGVLIRLNSDHNAMPLEMSMDMSYQGTGSMTMLRS